MKGRYKAIISDFDGTLVGVHGSISLPVQQAVKAWQDAGNMFVIATGRQYRHIRDACTLLKLQSPQVVRSGSEIVNAATGELLWSAYIPATDADTIMQSLRHYRIPFHAERDTIVYTADGHVLPGYDGTVFKPLSVLPVIDIPKLVLLVDDLDEEYVKKTVEENLRPHFPTLHIAKNYSPGRKTWDITARHATKETAVAQLQQLLGLHKDQTVGIGDGINDLPLFAATNYHIAMGNAPNELKAIAHFVAPSYQEDGMAAAIRHIISLT